jgi:methylmalonyl-CoA mutase, C-terminal domain
MTAPVRILASKLGLDGHDRGIRLITRELRVRGAEVIYLGVGTSPAQAARAAIEEDVDAIAVSLLSGSHLVHVARLMAELAELNADIPVVCGGLIAAADIEKLREIGVTSVMSVGTSVPAAAEAILDAALAPGHPGASPPARPVSPARTDPG